MRTPLWVGVQCVALSVLTSACYFDLGSGTPGSGGGGASGYGGGATGYGGGTTGYAGGGPFGVKNPGQDKTGGKDPNGAATQPAARNPMSSPPIPEQHEPRRGVIAALPP